MPAVLLAGVMRDGAPCSWADKVSTALDVVFGGLATTTHAMAGAMYEMARRRHVREAVMADADCLAHRGGGNGAPVRAGGDGGPQRARGHRGWRRPVAGRRTGGHQLCRGVTRPEVCAAPREFDVRRNEVVHTALASARTAASASTWRAWKSASPSKSSSGVSGCRGNAG
ncbi:MAG: hypothetical protein R3E84_23920 [Pseudomonadales bacterium]